MFRVFCLVLLLPLVVQAHDEIYEGSYTYGNEVSIFSECNSDKVYWLQGSGFLMSEVFQLALNANKPYTAIYLKFRGHEHFEEVDGYQASYDYQVHLSEVKAFSSAIPSNCN